MYAKVKEYLDANNRSEISQFCINYLLKEYLENKDFNLGNDTNRLYKSKSTPLLANSSNPNRALVFEFNDFAIDQGFSGFNNVLSELFKRNPDHDFEGFIIRGIFRANGLFIHSSVSNWWLGRNFNFALTNNERLLITFSEDNTTKDYGDKQLKKWYLDTDKDGYHAKGSKAVESGTKPTGNGWREGTSMGEDCDDTKANITGKKTIGELLQSKSPNTMIISFGSITSTNTGLGSREESSFGGGSNPRQPRDSTAFEEAPNGTETATASSFNSMGGVAFQRKRKITIDLFDKSDAELIDFFESTLRFPNVLNSNACQSADLIVNRFASKSGGILTNSFLGNMLNKSDGSGTRTMSNLINTLRGELCKNINKKICHPLKLNANVTLPNFSFSDPVLFAQLGGTQGLEVELDANGNPQIFLFDTFGVDEADVVKDRSGTFVGDAKQKSLDATKATRGIRAMWILQHQRGFKPFVQKVPLKMSNFPEFNLNNCN